jgi:ElaB/YqjD/DUF883 family membrane-anchored ribosome-binding protein
MFGKEFSMSRMNDPQNESAGSSGSAIGNAVNSVKETASNVAGKISDVASQSYDRFRDTASEYYQSGREKAQHWQEEVENYVQEQPIKSLLMAAGVGVLLGILWKRS